MFIMVHYGVGRLEILYIVQLNYYLGGEGAIWHFICWGIWGKGRQTSHALVYRGMCGIWGLGKALGHRWNI